MTVFAIGIVLTRSIDNDFWAASHQSLLYSANAAEAQVIAVGKPAVILFKRDKNLSAEVEPVYNLLAAWPDDELVIRAHDLGQRDSEIFDYYATHGPDRAFFRFDEADPDKLQFLGMASELARTKSGQTIGPP